MNKKLLFASLLAISMTSVPAQAGFGFGFSVNDCGPQVGFGVSVPFDGCCSSPRVGFGFAAPICRPVIYERVQVVRPARVMVRTVEIKRDSEGSKFWRILNDTNKTIVAINSTGKKVAIRPGQSAKLSHALSFELKVRFADKKNEYAVVKREGHNLTVKHRGGILVFDDYEFVDDEESEEVYEFEDEDDEK